MHAVTFGNTPQYGVRRLGSLNPAEAGSNHGGKTDGGEEIAPALPAHGLSFFSRLTLGQAVLGIICLGFGSTLCYGWYRERCIDAALEEAFPDSDSDDGKFIKRPDAEKLFDGFVQPPITLYNVIVGSHGTGKSTLARKVACKTLGMIYVNIPPTVKTVAGESSVEKNIDSAFREALRLSWTIPKWLPELLSRPSKRVLIIVFIVPRTDQFLPRRPPRGVEVFRAGCRPLQSQA